MTDFLDSLPLPSSHPTLKRALLQLLITVICLVLCLLKDPRYPVSPFFLPPDPSNSLYSAVLYLSPADYHHVHAPASLAISERVHVPGRLLPVLEAYAAHVKGLFTLNERVVLAGDWPYGSFALGMVGAYNVGSIRVQGDSVRTNLPHELLYEGHVHRRVFEKPWEAAQGERVGTFALGSTVVLAFEAREFEWVVKPGEKVKMGQPLGYVRLTKEVEELLWDYENGCWIV